ncbi:DUF2529 domain-containing protein [Mesobacillus foraminis]|uniref:Uncharacterized protein DUF2529 n=1 Tax=Mesobacillus foraminis TaxID=279826 RepID=A0A4R2BC82_9BACI|nr:DUF2529 domain-containing protein [Mesobacillus foraminis]TCN24035.1 uncharacterized protein DUF2529 [Mesobacillus foraminis]
MLKMFSTQLSGLFKRLQEHEDFAIEDGARLLAQAAAGHGTIYVFGAAEMGAIPLEAVFGAEPMKHAAVLTADQAEAVTAADRVLIATRHSNDPEAVAIAQNLAEKGIPFIGFSTVQDDSSGLESLADVHIDLKLAKGMLPSETGGRIGLPTSMAALFLYYGIKFTLDEILSEYDE